MRASIRRAQIGDALRGGLFPPATPAKRPLWAVAAGYVAAFVLAAVFLQTWMPHLDAHLWAEDGSIFATQANAHPLSWTFFHPYAGYMHAAPRLLAALIARLPVSDLARGYVAAAVLTHAALAVFVFRATAGHLRSSYSRALAAAVFVVLPLATQETLDNVANLHWFFIAAAFWALLWRPARWWEIALACVVVVFSFGSDPLSAFLAPLALARLLALRGVRDRVVAIAYFLAGVMQAIVVVRNAGRSMSPIQPTALQSVKMLGARVALGMFGGVHNTHTWYAAAGWFAIAIAAVAVGVLVAPAFAAGGPSRWLAAVALGLGVLLFLFTTRYAYAPGLKSVTAFLTQGGRYSVVPAILVWWAVVAGLDRVAWPSRGSAALVALGRVAVVGVLGWAVIADHGSSIADRTGGPNWPQALLDARTVCQTHVPALRISIAPPPWYVELSCATVRTSAAP